MIKAKIPNGSLASFYSIGMAKHAVFPLPVWAHPIICVPFFRECYSVSS
jgi:hypothetical protein